MQGILEVFVSSDDYDHQAWQSIEYSKREEWVQTATSQISDACGCEKSDLEWALVNSLLAYEYDNLKRRKGQPGKGNNGITHLTPLALSCAHFCPQDRTKERATCRPKQHRKH
jgi:hypothetical protein